MLEKEPIGPALMNIYNVRNAVVGECRVPYAVRVRVVLNERKYAALQLRNGYIVAEQTPLTAHTVLDMSLAHGQWRQSSEVVSLFGIAAATRVFKTPTAFVQACYYESRIRVHVDDVIRGVAAARALEGMSASQKLTAGDTDRLLARVVAHFRRSPTEEALDTLLTKNGKRYFAHIKGGPKDNKERLLRIGGCGARSGRELIKYEMRASADVADDNNKAELLDDKQFQAKLKKAFAADKVSAPGALRRALESADSGAGAQAAAGRKRKSASSSSSSSDEEQPEPAPADGDDEDKDDAEWRPESARAKRKKTAAATTAPPQLNAALGEAMKMLNQRIVESDAAPRDPVEAGRLDGARDVVRAVTTHFSTPPLPPPLLPTGARKSSKVGTGEAVEFLAQGFFNETPARDNTLSVAVVIAPFMRDTLASLLANPALCSATQRALLAHQSALREFAASQWRDATKSVLLLRREHVASERHWAECSAEFVQGVQYAFDALLSTGAAPTLATPMENEHDSRLITEVLELSDGRVMHERGVMAARSFALGECVGIYRCAPVTGGDDELDGEAALLRAAGVSELAAEDAYAVRAADSNDAPLVLSARRVKPPSLLALMNHSVEPNVELDGTYDHAAGGVRAIALDAIEAGQLLHINYGAGYIERMRALGVELGRSAGIHVEPIAQDEQQQQPPTEQSYVDGLLSADDDLFDQMFARESVIDPPAATASSGGMAFSPLKSQPPPPLFGGALQYHRASSPPPLFGDDTRRHRASSPSPVLFDDDQTALFLGMLE